jgi:hypothetical protein
MVSAIMVTYIYTDRNLEIFQKIAKIFRVSQPREEGGMPPLIGQQAKAKRSSLRKARHLLSAPWQLGATDLAGFATLGGQLAPQCPFRKARGSSGSGQNP